MAVEFRQTNGKERWIGAGAGALVTTTAAILFDAFTNPQGVNNLPIFWSQILLYSAIAGGGALMGGVIASDGRVRINDSLRKTGPLR